MVISKSKILKTLLFLFALFICIIAYWCTYLFIYANKLIPSYLSAQIITPLPQSNMSDREPIKWIYSINLPEGTQVTIEALSAFGQAKATYRDELSSKVIAPGTNYVWPIEIRLDPFNHKVYVLTSGFAGGLVPETKLYEYDLIQRKTLTCVSIPTHRILQNISR